MAWGITVICGMGINGLYQIVGESTVSIRNQAIERLYLHRETLGHKILQTAITFVLIDFSWIFFVQTD